MNIHETKSCTHHFVMFDKQKQFLVFNYIEVSTMTIIYFVCVFVE